MLTEHDSCYSDDQRGSRGVDVSEQALKRELEVNEQLDAASLWETRCKNSMGKLIELQIATDPCIYVLSASARKDGRADTT